MKRLFILPIVLCLALTGCASNDSPETADGGGEEVTTPSGLKYIDHIVGAGDPVQSGDTVEVHYTGWLFDGGQKGMQFDSSVGGDPFELTVGVSPVIEGWTEGLVGMKLGGKRELIIPAALGYGGRGAPPVIPPDATLLFEVDLLKLVKAGQ
jgi:FKBP-type peptidyl-prolyl cis-trans isomerase